MPQTHEIRLRRPPRYTKHPIKLIAAVVIFILTNCLLLVRDIQRHSDNTRAVAQNEAFEIIRQPGSGEVVMCTPTHGIITSRPILVGKFSECSVSNDFVQEVRHGRKGCFSFEEEVSALCFLHCVTDPDR